MSGRYARFYLLLAALWMVAMTWRLYPQFGDTIRMDGRLTTVSAYLDDTCGQRVGPAASTCVDEASERAQLQLRVEQGKSVLLILAPLLGFAVWLPIRQIQASRRARADSA